MSPSFLPPATFTLIHSSFHTELTATGWFSERTLRMCWPNKGKKEDRQTKSEKKKDWKMKSLLSPVVKSDRMSWIKLCAGAGTDRAMYMLHVNM